jgi:hypothetical protein
VTVHRSKEDLAIEVWVALETAQDGGLSLIELTQETGFTKNQVKAGLKEINHVKQLASEQPVMVDTTGWRYVLPEYYDKMLPWTIRRVRDLLTRLRAEETRIEAAALKWPTNPSARSVPRLVKRLVEDLTEVLAQVGGEGSSD